MYHFDGLRLSRLNANHSLAPQLDAAAERGEITVEEARNSSSRNVLLSAISGETISRVDVSRAPVELGDEDVIILASDGIETLSPNQISAIVSKTSRAGADAICNTLLNAVEEADAEGQDNTSIIVVTQREWPAANPGHNSDEIITRVIEPR